MIAQLWIPIVSQSKVVSFGSTETPKLAVSLFHETTETNLFVSDSVKTNFGSSFGCFGMHRVSWGTLVDPNYHWEEIKPWHFHHSNMCLPMPSASSHPSTPTHSLHLSLAELTDHPNRCTILGADFSLHFKRWGGRLPPSEGRTVVSYTHTRIFGGHIIIPLMKTGTIEPSSFVIVLRSTGSFLCTVKNN